MSVICIMSSRPRNRAEQLRSDETRLAKRRKMASSAQDALSRPSLDVDD
jgi:hypothetical protein